MTEKPGLVDKVLTLLRSLPPTPNSKREEILGLFQQRVGYYTPLIEEMCGVWLGPVAVKDYTELVRDYNLDELDKIIQRQAWINPNFSENDLAAIKLSNAMNFALSKPYILLYLNIHQQGVTYWHRAIYLPFGLCNRLRDPDFESLKALSDYHVIRALSMRMWEAISKYDCENIAPEWIEGYASYCAESYFFGIYPKSIKVRGDPLGKAGANPAIKGKEMISYLVDELGPAIVLEIPKRWMELEEYLAR